VKQQLKEEEEKELALYQELKNKPSKTLDELYQLADLAFSVDNPLEGVKVLRQIISTIKILPTGPLRFLNWVKSSWLSMKWNKECSCSR
jgi:hypothetical protein